MDNSKLCLSLINDAKMAGDADSKIQKLEQIKEILFKRSPQLLPSYGPYVYDFISESSVKVRKFLLQFAVEAFIQDKSMVINESKY